MEERNQNNEGIIKPHSMKNQTNNGITKQLSTENQINKNVTIKQGTEKQINEGVMKNPSTPDPADTGTTGIENTDCAKDLPLMSNITDIHITHYILQLKCMMAKKELEGSVLLFKCSDLVFCWKCTKKHKTPRNTQLFTMPRKCYSVATNTKSGQTEHGYSTQSSCEMPLKCSSDGTKTEHDYSTQSLCGYRKNTKGLDSNSGKSELSPLHLQSQSGNEHEQKSCSDASTDSCISGSDSKTTDNNPCENFKLVLDCCDIEIFSVEQVDIPLSSVLSLRNQFDRSTFHKLVSSAAHVKQLEWQYGNHSISIWKNGVHNEKQFPDVIRINYKTSSKGQSLKWTIDQSERPCVFSHGHWINNRSFFPSQDAPAAMATWEAEIEVPGDHFVVMGGDSNEFTTETDSGSWKREYFYSALDMPSSTLSIAIGPWLFEPVSLKKKIQIPGQNFAHRTAVVKVKSCRVIGPAKIVVKAHKYIQEYMPVCLSEVNKILPPYPFKRLDILIVPACFDSLGMASPSVIYISQSLLTEDCSMFVRLAHELCHSWFGLLIGPKDWTEEWLTEGFCSYLEDVLHINVNMTLWKSTLQEAIEETEIRKYLKYKTLDSELQNTETGLQTLRPNKDSFDGKSASFVKDGMNPDKRFLQVHYLKGYFLLCYLESFVDRNKFIAMLHSYVMTFYKELVSSREAVSFMFNVIPEYRERGLTVDGVITDWLDTPGMPEVMKNFEISKENTLYIHVENQLSKVRMAYPIEGCRKRKKTPLPQPSKLCLDDMSPIQLLLFFELLLDDDKVPESVLSQIHERYGIMFQNADVQHRWCELVIKHKAATFYQDITTFLLNHQAMGVYLYGELMLSSCKKQKTIAVVCFQALKDQMEPDMYATVKAMVCG